MEEYIFPDGSCAAYISSRQNRRVMNAARLSEKKYRDENGVFLCEGIKLTLEAAKYGQIIDIFMREENAPELANIFAEVRKSGAAVTVLSGPAFEKITTERAPQGIISIVRVPLSHGKWDGALPDGFILMLDSVRDPGNLGTIIRSACAFGCGTVVLTKCADPYGTKAVRAAMGALFKISLLTAERGDDFIKKVNLAGRRTLAAALDKKSLTLGEFGMNDDDCIIIGNEGHGISDEILAECSHSLRIPMIENTESLNAAAAAAVILWEYRSKTI